MNDQGTKAVALPHLAHIPLRSHSGQAPLQLHLGQASLLSPRAPSRQPRPAVRGFTLIEVMVGVAVVAILAAIAIPSYSAYVIRGKRAEGKTALLQAAQAMERIYTQSGCYSFTSTPCAGTQVTAPPAASPADYALSFLAGPAAQSYSLMATPTTFTDTDCGALTLDNTGAKGALGGSASAAVAQQCWGR